MKKLKCVFIIIFLIIAFTTVVSISKCQENELGSVAQGIIDEIETSGNDECMVELKTVTNFEWDRAIIASADFSQWDILLKHWKIFGKLSMILSQILDQGFYL